MYVVDQYQGSIFDENKPNCSGEMGVEQIRNMSDKMNYHKKGG